MAFVEGAAVEVELREVLDVAGGQGGDARCAKTDQGVGAVGGIALEITEGFYYGAGGGLGYATLKYKGRDANAVSSVSDDTETFNSTATVYSHSTEGVGLFAVLDAGWQGLENYYFQVSLQPSIYFYYKDGFQETSIPVDPNQRSTVKDRWSRAQDLSRLLLGFGVFF